MASFAAEPIFYLGNFTVTNSVLSTLFIDSIIFGTVYFFRKKVSEIPTLFQNIVEFTIETFYNFTESIALERTKYIFPFCMTFFLVILLTNWSGLIPGVGSIGLTHTGEHGEKELIPLLRAGTSDLNMTLALALISAFATHFLSIKLTGIKDYVSRFISLNPLNLFIGVLELISEITKVISLSFRLFGNIFAGEVVLLTVSSIFAFLAPLPFLFLEVIVGFVQALVFSMLTLTFMAILTTPHHAKEHTQTDKGVRVE